jgi:hypothetical protein
MDCETLERELSIHWNELAGQFAKDNLSVTLPDGREIIYHQWARTPRCLLMPPEETVEGWIEEGIGEDELAARVDEYDGPGITVIGFQLLVMFRPEGTMPINEAVELVEEIVTTFVSPVREDLMEAFGDFMNSDSVLLAPVGPIQLQAFPGGTFEKLRRAGLPEPTVDPKKLETGLLFEVQLRWFPKEESPGTSMFRPTPFR